LKIAIDEAVANGIPLDQPTLGHLWFLEDLCLFYLLIPLCLFIVRQSRPMKDYVNRWLRSPFALLALGFYATRYAADRSSVG